jgi:hypothetical protein
MELFCFFGLAHIAKRRVTPELSLATSFRDTLQASLFGQGPHPHNRHALSGQGTNGWRFVWPTLPTTIPAGTVFGGSSPYPLNARSGGFLDDRTYSMYAASR